MRLNLGFLIKERQGLNRPRTEVGGDGEVQTIANAAPKRNTRTSGRLLDR